MFSALRRRIHLSPATVIAGLALVFAMTGGAYAAKKYLITSTKQISPSVLKQLQGKSGANGAAGAAGAQGPQGPAGPAGPAGSAGAKGENGAAGKEGPQGKEGTTGAKGANGGAGAKGPTGPEGSPWTLGGTLPSGKTETGAWALGGVYNAFAAYRIAISFPIPLEAALDANHVREATLEKELVPQFEGEVFVGFEEVTPAKCLGTLVSPTAPAGYLCVYLGKIENFEGKGYPEIHLPDGELSWGAAKTGAALLFRMGSEERETQGSGTFAVTAP